MSDTDKVLYYAAWISKTGRVSLRWGRPWDNLGLARKEGKNEVDQGNASISFVVEFRGGEKIPLAGWLCLP